MSVKLSPVFNGQEVDANGDVAVGYKLFTYVSGSSTKQATYADSAGSTPHSNPIILDSLGYPTSGPIWLTAGQSYKFVLAPANDTDPPSSPVKTFDGVTGVNDASISVSQWQASGVAPTYISASSFALAGDQTSEFHVGRRLQLTTSGGTVYGTIATSSYNGTSLTTIAATMDGAQVLDSGLSAVSYGILRADHPALPTTSALINGKKGADIASAATVNLDAATGDLVTITGTATITAVTLASGAERTVVFAGTPTLQHNAGLILPGGVNIVAESGDIAVFRGDGALVRVSYHRYSGSASTAEAKAGINDVKAITPKTLHEAKLVLGTAVASTSGTAIDFTGIPAWANRITIMLSGVSTTSTGVQIIQIGTAGGVDAAGYEGSAIVVMAGGVTGALANTVGFNMNNAGAAADIVSGHVIITRISGNTWVAHGALGHTDSVRGIVVAGTKTLSSVLDRVRITTSSGAGTFDAGTINIAYE